MTDQMLDMIRRAIARGMDNDQIRDVLAVLADDTAVPPTVPAMGRRAVVSGTPLPLAIAPGAGRVTFVKPDSTTKTYRLLAAGRKALTAGKYSGNMLACLQYLAASGGVADTRAMRSAILTHKLDPRTGRNAAIESALYQLRTDGMITSKPKPVTERPTLIPGNGVELDDDAS